MKPTKTSIDAEKIALDSLIEAGVIKLGEFVLIDTFAPSFVGRLTAVTATTIILTDACWLADSGRKAAFIAHPLKNYVNAESYGGETVIVERTAISSWCTLSALNQSLPTK